jgi:predicted transposase YdaD
MPSFAEKLIKQGEERGEKRGEIKGTIKGKQDVLIKLLRRKFSLSSSDEKIIRSVTDEAKLDAAVEAIFDAKSKEEVLKILG